MARRLANIENDIIAGMEPIEDHREEYAPGMDEQPAGGVEAVGISPESGIYPADEPGLDKITVDRHQESDSVRIKRSHLYAVLLPLAFVVGLSVGYLFWGRDGGQGAVAVSPAPSTSSASANTPTEPQEVRRYDVPVDDDYVLGPEDAPITLIEFSDYECPYCRRFHNEVLSSLLDAFPGQIRFVYRDFPLTQIHPNAFPAAMAANCAGEQGAYYPFHDSLFSMRLGLNTEAYLQYASELGLDMPMFNACLDSAKYQAEVQADFEFAANLGISSTPTFFINGIPLVGAQSLEVFMQVIQRELDGEFQ